MELVKISELPIKEITTVDAYVPIIDNNGEDIDNYRISLLNLFKTGGIINVNRTYGNANYTLPTALAVIEPTLLTNGVFITFKGMDGWELYQKEDEHYIKYINRVDDELEFGSENPLTNDAITRMYNELLSAINSVAQTSSIGVTGSELYMSIQDSDVAGYKLLSNTIDTNETEITLTANSEDGIVWGNKYLTPEYTATTIPAKSWGFDYWRKVSNSLNNSTKHLRVFIYRNGVETNSILLTSPDINDTNFVERQLTYTFGAIELQQGDRIGVQEGFSTTRVQDVTLTYIIGDGRGWFMRVPLALSHKDTTDKNGEPEFQHVTQEEKDLIALTATIINGQSVTREELLTLINNNELIPNSSYRITNYTTTTVQTNTISAGHDFDIIVTALSSNELSEDAKCVRKAGDTYFTNAKLEAWEIKYRIVNDTNRFGWADTVNGKGVIYYMKDEWGNECPYDFKNIQFKKSDVFLYTFGGTTDNSLTGGCYYNTIMANIVAGSRLTLNFNTFGTSCSSNTFGKNCSYNTLGDACSNNIFGNNCVSNTFGNMCYSNTFGNNCYNNTFGNECDYNTFGYDCSSNTFGDNCNSNTFGDNSYNNIFDNGCDYNMFGNDCDNNTFGSYFSSNTFGDGCSYNNFYTGVSGNIKKNYIQFIVLEDGCTYNNFYSELTTSPYSYLQRIRIKGLNYNTLTDTQITLPATNTNYEWLIYYTSSGELKQHFLGYGLVDTKTTKETLVEDDKVPIYDSETGNIVLTYKTNVGGGSTDIISTNITNNSGTIVIDTTPNWQRVNISGGGSTLVLDYANGTLPTKNREYLLIINNATTITIMLTLPTVSFENGGVTYNFTNTAGSIPIEAGRSIEVNVIFFFTNPTTCNIRTQITQFI